MGQVPKIESHSTLLIGSGRLATHLRYYFSLLHQPIFEWNRQTGTDTQLENLCRRSSRILLAIRDDALEERIEGLSQLTTAPLIHFSGSLNFPKAFGVHPLMSFTPQLLAPERYPQIPLVLTEREPDLSELLPGWLNPVWRIAAVDKPYYHALCSMAGNMSALLWLNVFQRAEWRLKLPREIFTPYLRQVFENIEQQAHLSLTGPLSRGDQQVIQKHLQSLGGDELQSVYSSFVELFKANHHSRIKEKSSWPNPSC